MEQNGDQHCDVASTLPYTSEAPLVKEVKAGGGVLILFLFCWGVMNEQGKKSIQLTFPVGRIQASHLIGGKS